MWYCTHIWLFPCCNIMGTLMGPHMAYTHNKPCVTLLRWFGTIHTQGWQRTTKGDTLWPFAKSYTILQYSMFLTIFQCSLSLLQPFLTFSDAFRPFATFFDFTLFNTLPDCVTFSGTFHQTLFTWLVHHSFGIISGQSALHLCFLLPPLPKRTKSSPYNCTTVYWPQISLRPLSSLFSLAFVIYCTNCCRLFWNFITLSLWTLRLLEWYFLTIFGSPIVILTHSFSPLLHCKRLVTLSSHFSLYCGVCSVVVQTI